MFHRWFRFSRPNPRSRSAACPQTRRRHQSRPQIEALEGRYAPSCTSSVINRVLTVQCDNTNYNTVTVDVQFGVFTAINGSLFSFATHDSIQIIGGSAGLSTNIYANGKPLSLFGHHDHDLVIVGNTSRLLGGIQAALDLENPPFYNRVTIDDTGDNNASHTGTINVVTIGGSQFEQISGLGATAPINVKVADTEFVFVGGGPGGATINVLATAVFHPDPMALFAGTTVGYGSVNTLVNVGNNGSVQGIQAFLHIVPDGMAPTCRLLVDDSTDSGNRSVRYTDAFNPPIDGDISGLAPAVIRYDSFSQVDPVVIRTGTGTVTVDVEDTFVPTTFEGHSANTTVSVGANNSLANILAPLTITNPPSFTHVNINDLADTANHSNVTLTATSLTGLAPAAINFGSDDLASLTITGGSGSNVYNIVTTQNSGVPGGDLTTLNTGSGANTANVQGTSGAGLRLTGQGFTTNANLGFNNTLTGIHSLVTIVNNPSLFNVTVNDSADNMSHPNVQLSSNGLIGLAPAPIGFINSGSRLTINGGGGTNVYTIAPSQPLFPVGGTTLNTDTGNDVVYVQATLGSDPLAINAGSGGNVVSIGSVANTLDTNQSAMTVHGSGAPLQLFLNDQGNANPATWSVSGSFVSRTGTGGAGAFLSGVSQLTVLGGSGGNTFDLSQGVAMAMSVTLTGGSGSNTLLGSNAGNTWHVTGPDMGALSGSGYLRVVGFSQVGNLTAGSGGDALRFSDQAALSGSVAGSGNTTLDYSLYTTNVIVDLQAGFATGVGGLVSGIVNVTGASGAPGTPGLYNLLIGNGGNTLISGTGRRNLLVAGSSASILFGGDNDDLLIGGTTLYDTDPALASWLQIAAYWAGTDDYFTRVANLTSGNGVPLLDATVVTGNGGANMMIGNGELGLLYSDGNDNIVNFDPNSIVVPITP